MKSHDKLLFFDTINRRIQILDAKDWILFLTPGDLVIVNASGTLPSALLAQKRDDRQINPIPLNIRLATYLNHSQFNAIVYNDENNSIEFSRYDELSFTSKLGMTLHARIIDVANRNRLTLQFDCSENNLFSWIYQNAVPVSYSDSQSTELKLWDIQNSFSSIPLSNEWPFAGRLLTPSILIKNKLLGIQFAPLFHGCALSSFGNDIDDQSLPLPERYMINSNSLDLINRTPLSKRFCLGTSALRAIESLHRVSRLHHENFKHDVHSSEHTINEITDLRLSADEKTLAVRRLMMGFHEVDSSHFSILRSLLSESDVDWILTSARQHKFRQHEGGDFILIQ